MNRITASVSSGRAKLARLNPRGSPVWVNFQRPLLRCTDTHFPFPYSKLMDSNSNVDQAATLILWSPDVARRLRVPDSKWMYPRRPPPPT